ALRRKLIPLVTGLCQPNLAARRSREKLAQGDDVQIRCLIEPLASRNKLLAEVSKMRHRTAKGGQTELEKYQKYFKCLRLARSMRHTVDFHHSPSISSPTSSRSFSFDTLSAFSRRAVVRYIRLIERPDLLCRDRR